MQGAMSNDDSRETARDLERQALVLIQREWSGDPEGSETGALHRWCARSPAHEKAFADAVRLHAALLSIYPAAAAERPAPAVVRGRRLTTSAAWSRRAFIGGGLAASGAYLMVRPPGQLWPSLTELTADLRTRTGEQRQVAVNRDVALDMNTQTSVSLRGGGVELISGELAATLKPGAASPFTIAAGRGRVVAKDAWLNLRRDGDTVCVACLGGTAGVQHTNGAAQLSAGQQVIYGRDRIGAPEAADTEVVTAWRSGLLIFHHTPLRRALDEINRYRSGRLVLANAALAERPVLGVFEIRQIDLVVDQLQQLSGARLTRLPGQIVIFS